MKYVKLAKKIYGDFIPFENATYSWWAEIESRTRQEFTGLRSSNVEQIYKWTIVMFKWKFHLRAIIMTMPDLTFIDVRIWTDYPKIGCLKVQSNGKGLRWKAKHFCWF